ncbi:MAG TPA: ethanolamine ammonia-lyase reactivating factor EutA [bacterium]|nr:ethanolamine ammonia-lyase reactivating factor EutA [bacterium]
MGHEDDNEHIHLGGDADPAVYVGEHIKLRSAGIDIGSSTSHLVFSELVLTRQGRYLSSRYQVVKRDVSFRSRVTLTPYASPSQIDTARIAGFIDEAYREAGIARSDIDSGAVITTGEAAMKENAGPIIDLFSADAGKFVCATAGPHLESLLAAHGSGAAALSREPQHPTILNVDIGGGTTKFAVCRKGAVQETAAIHVGARLIAWRPDGTLERVEERGRALAAAAGARAEVGVRLPAEALDAVAGRMADLIARVVAGQYELNGDDGLWITERLRGTGPFTHLVFSGGVAEYIYGCETAEFGDLGPRLARALAARCRDRVVLNPTERIRATCIGASQYTVQVSGNTIFLSDTGVLPVRNVPVAAVRGLDGPSPDRVAEAVRRGLRRLDLADGRDRFALAVHWHHGPEYSALSALCTGIVAALPETVAAGNPLFVVIDADVAGLIGRILRDECGLRSPVICIDQVALREFDYVDIGSLMPEQQVVPVVVKSLVFH